MSSIFNNIYLLMEDLQLCDLKLPLSLQKYIQTFKYVIKIQISYHLIFAPNQHILRCKIAFSKYIPVIEPTF